MMQWSFDERYCFMEMKSNTRGDEDLISHQFDTVAKHPTLFLFKPYTLLSAWVLIAMEQQELKQGSPGGIQPE